MTGYIREGILLTRTTQKGMMKKTLTKIMVILLVTFGFTGIGAAANASPAHAGTASSCRVVDAGYGRTFLGTNYRYATYCYVDYDWVEEVFFGMHDGWRFVNYHHDRCDWSYGVC